MKNLANAYNAGCEISEVKQRNKADVLFYRQFVRGIKQMNRAIRLQR